MRTIRLLLLLLSLLFVSCSENKNHTSIEKYLTEKSNGIEFEILSVNKIKDVFGKDSLDFYKSKSKDIDRQIKVNDSLVSEYQKLILENIKAKMTESNNELKDYRNKYLKELNRLKSIKKSIEYYTPLKDSLMFEVYKVNYKALDRDVTKMLGIKNSEVIHDL